MAIDYSDPVVSLIVRARVALLMKEPFFGSLVIRLQLVDATSWCSTAATDGRNLYYNREFIKALKPAELLFLLGHEVLHCVYDHFGRRNGRDPKIYNMASDYIINYTLKKANLGEMPESGLYDEKFTDEMSSEEVYEILKKNSTTIKMPLDEHLEDSMESGDDDGEGNGGQMVEVTVMGKDGPPKITKEDREAIRNEIRAAAIQAAQTYGAGKVPSGVLRLIDSMVEPKLDWRSLLDAHIKSALKDDYTWQRMSRRSWYLGGPILPSQMPMETIKIFVAVDTSGSIGPEQLKIFFSEVKSIMETFKDFEVHVISFDATTHNYKVFTMDAAEDITSYVPEGGGGTVFASVWDFMIKENIEVSRLVMFTDGYDGGPSLDEYSDYVDTLFIIHGGYDKYDPGFGIVVPYEDS